MGEAEDTGKKLLPADGKKLWEGCMLALCVNAVMLPEYPFIIDEHVWLDGIYMTADHAGAKALVAFSEDRLPFLGIFRQYSSKRAKLALTDAYALSHFKPAPEEIRNMAEAAFCLFEEEVEEQKLPIVTTGFWAEEGGLYSLDSLEDWLEHGGSILEAQIAPFEDAMEYYVQYCSMDPERRKVAERVYGEKILAPDKEIVLSRAEIKAIEAHGDVHNMGVCRETFEKLNVYFEK